MFSGRLFHGMDRSFLAAVAIVGCAHGGARTADLTPASTPREVLQAGPALSEPARVAEGFCLHGLTPEAPLTLATGLPWRVGIGRPASGSSARSGSLAFVYDSADAVYLTRTNPERTSIHRIELPYPIKGARSSVASAVNGNETAVVTNLYASAKGQPPSLELSLVDGTDRLRWQTVLGESPGIGRPALAWGPGGLAVAWAPDPANSGRRISGVIEVTRVDPTSGTPSWTTTLPLGSPAQGLAIVWDRDAYAVAWMEANGDVVLTRVSPNGAAADARDLAHGCARAASEPALGSSVDTLAVAYPVCSTEQHAIAVAQPALST